MDKPNEVGKLIWKDEYSVNVKEIDEQHKHLVGIINNLVDAVSSPNKETIADIIDQIIQYKTTHFATEEKYFHEFNYEDTKEHEARHHEFSQRIQELKDQHKEDTVSLGFTLVDFLENWFVTHLNLADHKYTKCFNEHGLY